MFNVVLALLFHYIYIYICLWIKQPTNEPSIMLHMFGLVILFSLFLSPSVNLAAGQFLQSQKMSGVLGRKLRMSVVCGEGRVFAPKPIKNQTKREVVNFSNPKREVVKQCHPKVVSNSPNKKIRPFPYAMRAGKVHRAPLRS